MYKIEFTHTMSIISIKNIFSNIERKAMVKKPRTRKANSHARVACIFLCKIHIQFKGQCMQHIKKVLPCLRKKIRCVTRGEKLFQTWVRCFQHSSQSRAPSAPSTPTRVAHLTLARIDHYLPLLHDISLEYRTLFFERKCGKLNLVHAFLLERAQNRALRT